MMIMALVKGSGMGCLVRRGGGKSPMNISDVS